MQVYILVVENFDDFRQTLCEHLKIAGYHPVEARVPAEVDAFLPRYRFLAAIVDIRMKDENDAHDLSGLIKARTIAEKGVPVIILSAYDSPEDIERAYTVSLQELAPRAFISKNWHNWREKLMEVLADINAERRKPNVKQWLQDHWQELLSFIMSLWRKIFS